MASFIRPSSPYFELENHQSRLNVGDIGFVQASFKGTSPTQLHQRTISEQYCNEHLNDVTAISGIDSVDMYSVLHLLQDYNIRTKAVSFLRAHHSQLEHLILMTAPTSGSSVQQPRTSQQSPRDMDIDDETYTTVIRHSADVHINIRYK